MPLFITDSNNVLGASVQEAGLYNVKIVKAEVGKTGRGQQKITLDYEICLLYTSPSPRDAQ